jgi:hypothetical protein
MPAKKTTTKVDWRKRYRELLERVSLGQDEKLAEIHKLRKLLAAEKTSVEFWTYEASRWRNETEELRRAQAVSRVERGVR